MDSNTEQVTHDVQAWAQVARELGLTVLGPVGMETVIFNNQRRGCYLLVTPTTLSAGEEGSEQFVPTTAAKALALLGRMIKKD